jgi:exosortase A-associated hydrolase 2
MREEPFFFPDQTGRLFGVHHDGPAGREGAPRLPFVFCHPFGEEKLWTHRVFVTFARALAQRGHPVLRFDYRGNGDSSGDFPASSIATALDDLATAIETIKSRTGATSVGLVGLRLGASLAATAAETHGDVSCLVLWAPIVDGARYAQDLLRINITTQMAVYREVRQDRAALVEAMKQGQTANVDGYEVGFAMYDELSRLSLKGGPATFAHPALVVQLDRAPNAPPQAELTALAGRYAAGALVQVQEEPFWKEIERFYDTAPNLFAATLEWMDRHV